MQLPTFNEPCKQIFAHLRGILVGADFSDMSLKLEQLKLKLFVWPAATWGQWENVFLIHQAFNTKSNN